MRHPVQVVLEQAVQQGTLPGGLALVDHDGAVEVHTAGSWTLGGPR